MDELESERNDWIAIAAMGLARAYGDDEPEYGLADVKPDEVRVPLLWSAVGVG